MFVVFVGYLFKRFMTLAHSLIPILLHKNGLLTAPVTFLFR